MPSLLNGIGLINGMSQKMDYLQTRQRVLSENMSNSDTPGFQAHDIKEPDFAAALGRADKAASGKPLNLAATNQAHISSLPGHQGALKSEVSRKTYEVTPEGNSVTIEEQMMKASQSAMDYQLVTNLYNKNLDILRLSMKN